MALDEILLGAVADNRSQPVLRLYRWNPPAVTIGYAQNAADVNLENCRRFGYDVIRRSTGGRAVLHENECTYAVIAHTGTLFPFSISGSYRVIAAILQESLASLGLPIEMAEGRRRERQPGICFTAPGQGELLCRNRKIAGSSQKRQGRTFLQHGSIPVDLDLERLSLVLGAADESSRADSAGLGRTIGWVNRFLPKPVSITEVEDAVIASFAAALPICFVADQPTPEEWEAARKMAALRYSLLGFEICSHTRK